MRPFPWWLMLALVACLPARGGEFLEDFSSDPLARGWGIFGDASLFQWDAANQDLVVTWDSSRTNSYFFKPLGTVLTRDDDFAFAFDLRLQDIAIGVNAAKPFTFEIAVGFFNLASASDPGWQRGSGRSLLHGPRNLAEFDYFPDSGYGPTVAPILISSNNEWAYYNSIGLTLDPGALFHVQMSYTASNATLSTVMTRDGAPFGPIHDVVIGTSFTDFRLTHLGIMSYSDAGADGSLLAHGTVDTISVTTPAPPVANFAGQFSGGTWQVPVVGASNWVYVLERTTDLVVWTGVSGPFTGSGDVLVLQDTSPPEAKAYYRVHATRP